MFDDILYHTNPAKFSAELFRKCTVVLRKFKENFRKKFPEISELTPLMRRTWVSLSENGHSEKHDLLRHEHMCVPWLIVWNT